MLRWISVALLSVLVSGCRPSPPVVDDAAFEFQLGQGSGRDGLDLLKVTADGQAVYEYRVKGGWNRKRFSIDKAHLVALIDKIADLKIFDLHKQYHANIEDGTQWCVLIKGRGGVKAIYCNNNFPEPIKQLAEFVHETIIIPLGDRAAAWSVPFCQEGEHDKEIWKSIKD